MSLTRVCNKGIEYTFYLLFLLTPFLISKNNSELFEFNKMWFVFGATIVVTGFWIIKMITQKKVWIQKTPLDVPIALFLLSQILSTLFSLDRHISIWGYYTRWNGGLLSTVSYILLYYTFVSNLLEDSKTIVKRVVQLSLLAAAGVALWGFPSHFGYDPTCLLFRGKFDVSCWTADFQPKIRIFSTLGQPDWLAAYLDIMLPISIALFVAELVKKKKNVLLIASYLSLIALFYTDLNFTGSRSGYIAFWISFLFLLGYVIWKKQKDSIKHAVIPFVLIILISLFVTSPLSQLQPYSIPSLLSKISHTATTIKPEAPPAPAATELGGSDSGKIRSFVWQGAIEAWKNNPIFGTGVETFAFAYYLYKPAGHNLTSEWDFLYNKAHNEYLNYLATTGIFGLGTYLAIIGFFLWISLKLLTKKGEHNEQLLIAACVASFLSILITDFFGFSVVMTNLYLFFIPLLVFMAYDMVTSQNLWTIPSTAKHNTKQEIKISFVSFLLIIVIVLIGSNMIYNLIAFWQADQHYYYGLNYDKLSQYVTAYQELHQAVRIRGDEPVFQDELSYNDAVIATQLAYQKEATQAAQVGQEGLDISNRLTNEYPDNILFWKTRTRIFYTLSQVDPQYLILALTSLQKAAELAPTDAKIAYNLGVLYGQTNDPAKGIEELKKAIQLKSNYIDAYYALALFYRTEAINGKGVVVNQNNERQAVAELHYILQHLDPKNKQALDSLKQWNES